MDVKAIAYKIHFIADTKSLLLLVADLGLLLFSANMRNVDADIKIHANNNSAINLFSAP